MRPTHLIHQILAGGVLALILGLSAPRADAIVIVTLDVTPSGPNYHYDVSVNNGESVDLVLVTLLNAPLGDGLITASLTAPAGFFASYDSGLGFIDFLGNTSDFLAVTTTSGFSFDSASAPAGFFTGATALDASGAFYDGRVDINLRTVPDAGGTLLTLALSLGALALGRKQFSAPTP